MAVAAALIMALAAAPATVAMPAATDDNWDDPALRPGSHLPATELRGSGEEGAPGCGVPPEADDRILLVIKDVLDANDVTAKVRLATYETAWVESHANDLDCGDGDSVGVFQQRPSTGWTHAGDPARAAYDFLHGNPSDSTYGAIQWDQARPTWTAGQIAQAVQRSAYPTRYDEAEVMARKLINRAEQLDGDGNDEVGFYRKSDGHIRWYEMTSTGGRSQRLSAQNLRAGWTSIIGADLSKSG